EVQRSLCETEKILGATIRFNARPRDHPVVRGFPPLRESVNGSRNACTNRVQHGRMTAVRATDALNDSDTAVGSVAQGEKCITGCRSPKEEERDTPSTGATGT